MNSKTFVNLAFGVAVSVALLYGMWHWYGPFGLVFGMPVIAICAIPLLESFNLIPWLGRWLAFRKFEGRYYAYRGRHVDIDIDAKAVCWINTADARKILPSLPADAVLARLQPGLVKEAGDPLAWRITPEALAAVLAKATDPETAKFLQWLEGEVASPARKKLERGVVPR